MGRAIWTVTAWFLGAIIAALATGLVATIVYRAEIVGIVIVLIINLTIRFYVSKRSDAHEKEYHSGGKSSKAGAPVELDDD